MAKTRDEEVVELKIPTKQLREGNIKLRDAQTEHDDYATLKSSIKKFGFTSQILVMPPKVDPETNEEYYEIIDGLQRTSICRELGIEKVPARICKVGTSADSIDKELLQLAMNLGRIETKPGDCAKHLKHVLEKRQNMTNAELAASVGKSLTWLNNILKINGITDEEIMNLVNTGKICTNNAIALSKLPADEQKNFVQAAMTDPTNIFAPSVHNRAKEIAEAKKEGRAPKPRGEFMPVPHCQKMGVLKAELEKTVVGAELVKKFGCKTPEDGWKLAIEWAMHMDPDSVAAQKAEYEERKAAREKAALERKAVELQKKQEEAAKAVAALDKE